MNDITAETIDYLIIICTLGLVLIAIFAFRLNGKEKNNGDD